jgi:hypothetical protein
MRNTKLEAHSNGCVIRRRNALAHEITTMTVKIEDKADKI